MIRESSPEAWACAYSNWEPATTSPPVHTKTWFHTGVQLPAASVEDLFRAYYWDGESNEIGHSTLPSSIRVGHNEFVSHGLNSEETREAYRALKGSALHSEVYALDGSQDTIRPYTVSQSNFVVEMLQPQSTNQHAIFHTRSFEAVKSAHDRQLYLVDGRMDFGSCHATSYIMRTSRNANGKVAALNPLSPNTKNDLSLVIVLLFCSLVTAIQLPHAECNKTCINTQQIVLYLK